MSYLRPMGDGPITSPDQVPATHPDELDIGTIGPTRVPCDELPADSPWKRPGSVCAQTPTPGIFDPILDALDKMKATPATDAAAAASTFPWLPVAAAAAALYFVVKRKKKR